MTRYPLHRRALGMLAPLALGGCGGVLDPAGPVGRADALILANSVAIMLVIVIPTITAALAFAWWFRSGNARARYRPDWAYSGQLELLTWSVPVLIVMFLGGVAWVGSHRLDPYRPLPGKPIEIDVVALDWKWLFIYPGQGIATVNAVTVPAGVPVRFRITSASVMNAFFVPRLGSMVYAMNGMTTELNLRADKAGRYRGMSSHFSGDGFPTMTFALDAVPAERFAGWVKDARLRGGALDERAYAALAVQSSAVTPYSYRAVDPRLFDGIVSQRLAPAPGPHDPGATVHPVPPLHPVPKA